jgi:hypothetical protein
MKGMSVVVAAPGNLSVRGHCEQGFPHPDLKVIGVEGAV